MVPYNNLRTLWLHIIILSYLLFCGSQHFFATATIHCTPGTLDGGDSLCAKKYRDGSYCTPEGVCWNPFVKGCLRSVLSKFEKKLRACNSDDPPDAAFRGICVPSEYEEVRILSQNWESPMFSSWIMQILLSELLNVPVTIETSMPDTEGSFNFYDPEMRFTFSNMTYVSLLILFAFFFISTKEKIPMKLTLHHPSVVFLSRAASWCERDLVRLAYICRTTKPCGLPARLEIANPTKPIVWQPARSTKAVLM